MRRIFVGDIQGCCEELLELMSATGFDPGRDELYPVGDLVAKGPDSPGVLRVLMDVGARPVLGNHDLNWLAKGLVGDPAAERWLREQPIVRVLHDVVVVHGGLHPRWSEAHLAHLSEADVRFAVAVRYCDEEGNRPRSDWPPPGEPFRPWFHFYRGDKRVVFGHWARLGLVQTEKVIGLDTGCVYGRQLTAWIAEEDRIVQVPGWES